MRLLMKPLRGLIPARPIVDDL